MNAIYNSHDLFFFSSQFSIVYSCCRCIVDLVFMIWNCCVGNISKINLPQYFRTHILLFISTCESVMFETLLRVQLVVCLFICFFSFSLRFFIPRFCSRVWGNELRSLVKIIIIIIICLSLLLVCMQQWFQPVPNHKLTHIMEGKTEVLTSCKFNERKWKSVQYLAFGVHFLNGTAVSRNWNRKRNNALHTYDTYYIKI